MATVTRHSTDVGPVQLSYLAAGPAHGPVVVLLHGIPASAELWRGVLGRLGDAGYRAYAPDLPGYGGTRVPDNGDRSLGGAADVVSRWIATHGLGPVWLVGHDLGGAAAQILATTHPDQLTRLTLSDTPCGDNWPVPPIARIRAIARTGLLPALAAAGLAANPYTNWELRRGFADPSRLSDDDRARVFWDGKLTDPRGRQEFAAHLRALDPAQTVAVVDRLAVVDLPVLLVWATGDRFLPWAPDGERLRDAFDRGRAAEDSVDVVLLEDAGHFVPVERPDAFAEALLSWPPPR